jgi:RimJ/RimL family protein N-acetyltransferase
MDRQPVLIGERLVLRPLRDSDWDALYAVAGDPRLWAMHPAHDRWQEPVFRAFFADALAQGGALAVTEGEGGAVIGSSRFQGYDPADGGSVEIGWTFLARELWGSGLNAEMKRLMLTHALQFVERVEFSVGVDNAISRRAMAKIGGRLTNRTRMVERGGALVEHLVFEISRADYAAGPLANP